MKRIQPRSRRSAAAVLLGLAVIAMASLLAVTRSGDAATTVKPTNVNPPTIAGNAQEGQTLTAGNGTWSGTTPITFTYQWDRCDKDGKNCTAIGGATQNTYVVQHADVGGTLLVHVTGTNADGVDHQPSSPTKVVTTAPAPTGCPSGTGVIQIADLQSPARLLIDQMTVTPGVVTPAASSIQTHFRVTACGGRPVQGALVYAAAIPYNQYSVPQEGTTGADGTVNLTMNQLSGFPATRQQRLLVVFARARKSGEDILGGVSTRRLVSFHVSLK